MILALRDVTSRHDAGRSLYGRSKARLPTGPASWPTRRGTCPIMVLTARSGRWLLPTSWPAWRAYNVCLPDTCRGYREGCQTGLQSWAASKTPCGCMIVRHAESKTRVRLHLALVHCNISCMLAHSYPGCDRFSCRKRMGLSLGRSTVYGKEGITEAVRVRRATAKGIVL